MWLQKHKPKVEEIWCHETIEPTLSKWLDEVENGTNTYTGFFLNGFLGTGKSAYVKGYLKQRGYYVQELAAYEKRDKAFMQQSFLGMVQMKSMLRNVKRCVVVDEVESLAKTEKSGLDELISYFASTKRKLAGDEVRKVRTIPIICLSTIGNLKKDQIDELKKETMFLALTEPSKKTLETITKNLFAAEDLEVDDSVITTMQSYAMSDIRLLVNTGQYLTSTEDDVDRAMDHLVKNKQNLYISDAMFRYMNNPSFTANEVNFVYTSDKSKTAMFVHENYPRAIATQSATVTTQLNHFMRTIDSICFFDVIENMMYLRNYWILSTMQGAACVQLPYHYIHRKPHGSSVWTKWPDILSVNAQAQNLKKCFREEVEKISTECSRDSQDLHHYIVVVLELIMKEKHTEAMQYLFDKKLLDSDELMKSSKRIVTVLDSLSKYIKISKTYGNWQTFYKQNKSNKELDAILRSNLVSTSTFEVKLDTPFIPLNDRGGPLSQKEQEVICKRRTRTRMKVQVKKRQ